MGWKDWPYWLRFGVVMAMINILLSTFAYMDKDIRQPHDFSDFKALRYPNVLLGIPALIVHERAFGQIYKSIYPNYPGIISEGGKVTPSSTYRQSIDIFTSFFVSLTIYHFLLGAIVGWIYGKIKSRKSSSE